MKNALLIFFVVIFSSFYKEKRFDNLCASGKINQNMTPPEFPGGNTAFTYYVLKNIKWPKNVQKDTLQMMEVTFFVEKDGSLSGLKIEKSLSSELDAQVINILSKSPRWIPATQFDKPIKSKYRLPIRYHSSYKGLSN